jgi:hypothetical protein
VRHGAPLRCTWQARPACSACACTTTAAARRPNAAPSWRDALDRQAYEGRMGLGLMLADLVARAHGGELTLPEVADSGFAVELQLGLTRGAAVPT